MCVRILTLDVRNAEGDPRRPEIISHRIRQLEPDPRALQEGHAGKQG